MSSPISGFTAIPNPQMLAFMPIQSYLMMYFAGSGWQYGKRKISAMSNEEFNKLTPMALISQHSDELKAIMPTLEKSLKDVTPLIRVLIEQYGEFIVEAIKVTPQVAQTTGFDIGTEILKQFGTTREATGINPTQAQMLAYADILIKKIIAEQRIDKPPKLNLTEQVRQEAITLSKPSTISGLTVGQAREQARQKQLSYEEQQRTRARQVEQLVKIPEPIPQVRQGITKRAAGQSAKNERIRLIRAIAEASSNSRRTTQGTQYALTWARKLREVQQRLVNLLARYRF